MHRYYYKQLKVFSSLVLAVALLFCATSSANDLTRFGFTSRSISMGGATTASAKDISAVYYNPSNIADADDGFMLGMFVSINALEIALHEKPAGSNVDEFTDGAGLFPSVPTNFLLPREDTANEDVGIDLQLGLVHKLGVDWLKGAVAVVIPLNDNLNVAGTYSDEREAYFSNKLHFTTLGPRQAMPLIMTAVSVKPVCWFKMGMGVNFHYKLIESVKMFNSGPDEAAPNSFITQRNLNLGWTASLTAGIQFDLLEWLAFGISYRQSNTLHDNNTNQLQIFDGQGMVTHQHNYDHLLDYSPHDLTFGIRLGKGCPFEATVDLLWRMWSLYAPADGSRVNPFKDAIIPRVGMSLKATDWLDIRLGLSYVMSAVRDQPGRTNYVDNNRIEIGLGGGLNLPWPPDATLNVHGQVLALIPRTFTKDANAADPVMDEFAGADGIQTNNPGYPGYDSSGVVGTVGVNLNVPFK